MRAQKSFRYLWRIDAIRNTIEVANEVRDLHVASLMGNEIDLLYERNRRLVSAAFDSSSLAKKNEREIELPQLK